ncbi:MAG: alpha/beta fold hydrolase [Thermoleophilia bacterium]|nr:alpha/beta fold hydrolase [Thermoleophilia bacterium]
MADYRHIFKKAAKIIGLVLAGLLVVLFLIAVIPINTSDLVSQPDPATSYEDSVGRIQTVIADEAGKVCDICGTRFYTHGARTEKAVVLVHGLTNSPRQFEELGQMLYNDGYNVLIPRLPYHGLQTHTVSELANTTTKDLRLFSDQIADMAAGLGDEITVVGLSGGGTVAAWIAQNRSDVTKVVMIAPLYGVAPVPPLANEMLGNLFTRIPDITWSSSSEAPRESVYMGWSTRGVAEYMVFSRAAKPSEEGEPSQVKDIVLVTNGNDHTVNNGMSEVVVQEWETAGAAITRYQFDESLGLPHDVVDMASIGDKSQWIYPILIGLIE